MLELTGGLFLSICIAESAVHRKLQHLQLHGQEVAVYQYENTSRYIYLSGNDLVSWGLVNSLHAVIVYLRQTESKAVACCRVPFSMRASALSLGEEEVPIPGRKHSSFLHSGILCPCYTKVCLGRLWSYQLTGLHGQLVPVKELSWTLFRKRR